MGSNENVVIKNSVPVKLQGRVYACRNALRFFTIPIGLFLGGFMVDEVFEPLMETYAQMGWLSTLFGSGKGSGAAMVIFLLGMAGIVLCLVAGRKLKQYSYQE